jgi:mercuric reductase
MSSCCGKGEPCAATAVPAAMSSAQHVVVVGGGSAAFSAALKAASLGARVTVCNDRLPTGGTCVNVGCVPSKTLIRAAEAVANAGGARFDGITTSGSVVDFGAIMRQKTELVEQLRKEKYVDVIAKEPNITLINGHATVGAGKVEVNGETLAADKIILATGVRPSIPPIEGLSSVDYLTNESLFELTEIPKSLIVLGGRYVGLECGQMFARFGTDVTIIQRSSRILPDEAADLTDVLTTCLREENITVVTGAAIGRVSAGDGVVKVHADVNGVPAVYSASRILVATTRAPNTEGFAAAGIELNKKGFVVVDETLRTNVSGVFAAGDVVGKPQFVYTAAADGELAARNAVTGSRAVRHHDPLPWVVFTDPQVAGVGLDSAEATAAGIEVEASTVPLSYVPRAIAARNTHGFVRLFREVGTHRIVGARVVASEGGELLMAVAMSIRAKMTSEDVAGMLHPYLTLSEAVKLACISFDRSVSELSCCASGL